MRIDELQAGMRVRVGGVVRLFDGALAEDSRTGTIAYMRRGTQHVLHDPLTAYDHRLRTAPHCCVMVRDKAIYPRVSEVEPL